MVLSKVLEGSMNKVLFTWTETSASVVLVARPSGIGCRSDLTSSSRSESGGGGGGSEVGAEEALGPAVPLPEGGFLMPSRAGLSAAFGISPLPLPPLSWPWDPLWRLPCDAAEELEGKGSERAEAEAVAMDRSCPIRLQALPGIALNISDFECCHVIAESAHGGALHGISVVG